ncbi:MAG: hypothetical protein ABIK45_10885 [Pseudomonadota bacterium]
MTQFRVIPIRYGDAYLLRGTRLMFLDRCESVRGFLSPTRKVALSFEAQQTKVCLNNCRTLAMQEVLLVFEGGRWNREAGDDCIYQAVEKRRSADVKRL